MQLRRPRPSPSPQRKTVRSGQTRDWLTRPGGLAHRLKLMREAAGLTGEQLAEATQWDRTKVSKIENGRTYPTAADIRRWAAACGQRGAADELVALGEEGQALHTQWRQRLHGGQVAIQTEWDELVRAATAIFNFELAAVPGLLQTPDYARSMMLQAVRFHGASVDGIDAAIAARARRQQELYNSDHTFQFVIFEAALRIGAAPPPVMIGQLHSITTLAQLPHVTVGIIPLGVPVRLFPQNSFIAVDDVVRFETFGGLVTVTGDEAATYLRLTAPLMDQAVTGPAADRLIASIMGWWRSQETAGPR